MGSFSAFHWIVVLLVILILFGAGKLPQVMGDLAKGVKAFKAGMKDDAEADKPAPPPAATAQRAEPPAEPPRPS
ncbi:twin-arginine translocase TatA/TatE family subunit [Azospirillum sp. sgz301742]